MLILMFVPNGFMFFLCHYAFAFPVLYYPPTFLWKKQRMTGEQRGVFCRPFCLAAEVSRLDHLNANHIMYTTPHVLTMSSRIPFEGSMLSMASQSVAAGKHE